MNKVLVLFLFFQIFTFGIFQSNSDLEIAPKKNVNISLVAKLPKEVYILVANGLLVKFACGFTDSFVKKVFMRGACTAAMLSGMYIFTHSPLIFKKN